MKWLIAKLETYADRAWYPPLLAFIAAADAFLIFIPADVLLISSILLVPQKWVRLFVWLTIGSTISTVLIAMVVEAHGITFITEHFPALMQSSAWTWSDQFMHRYGIWAVFIISISPVMQHPVIALAALAQIPTIEIALLYLLGRGMKYALVAWIASHAPHLLKKFWGFPAAKVADEVVSKVVTENESSGE